MSYLDEKIAIESYFQDNWPYTAVLYENDIDEVTNPEWIRMTILNGLSHQVTLGCQNPEIRNIGVLVLQVFVKINTGSGRALELADKIIELFSQKRLGNIQFKVPQIQKVPIDKDSYWYQLNVSTDFFRG